MKKFSRKYIEQTRGEWMPFIYFVVGQVGWFGSVLSAAKGHASVGVILSACLIAAHLLRVSRAKVEFKLIVTVMLLGGLWESAMTDSGWLGYPNSARLPGLAPYWIIALWGLFAAQLNTTYGWLKKSPMLAVLLGAIAGPISFHGGARLGALSFSQPWPATIALAVGWACLLPIVVLLALRWNGVSSTQEPPGSSR